MASCLIKPRRAADFRLAAPRLQVKWKFIMWLASRTERHVSTFIMKPFPSESHLRWRRLDVPGREEARIKQTAEGWRLKGQLEADEQRVHARSFVESCDARTPAGLRTGPSGPDTLPAATVAAARSGRRHPVKPERARTFPA